MEKETKKGISIISVLMLGYLLLVVLFFIHDRDLDYISSPIPSPTSTPIPSPKAYRWHWDGNRFGDVTYNGKINKYLSSSMIPDYCGIGYGISTVSWDGYVETKCTPQYENR